jgi:hypothetical protein
MITKEIAKFLCGAETFHALAHAYCWQTGITLNFLGFTATPQFSMYAAGIDAIIALALGFYAWGRKPRA